MVKVYIFKKYNNNPQYQLVFPKKTHVQSVKLYLQRIIVLNVTLIMLRIILKQLVYAHNPNILRVNNQNP